MSLSTRTKRVSDSVTYSYIVSSAHATKPTLLFLHGFPSNSKDWEAQCQHFALEGFGIIAPDLLGYGDTSKPSTVSEYNWRSMCSHIGSILDEEGIATVIAVGHDLGSWFLSRLVHLLPGRVTAAAFLDVGYVPPGQKFDVEMINRITKEMTGSSKFGYWNFFCSDDGASLTDKHTASMLSLMHADPAVMADNLGPLGKAREWIEQSRVADTHFGDQQAQAFRDRLEIFEHGGWTGPLNWYKALSQNISFADEQFMEKDLKMPTLLITCGRDQMTLASLQDQLTRAHAKGYYRYEVLDTGHWLMMEQPDETNNVLEEFFEHVIGP